LPIGSFRAPRRPLDADDRHAGHRREFKLGDDGRRRLVGNVEPHARVAPARDLGAVDRDRGLVEARVDVDERLPPVEHAPALDQRRQTR
jgi:hypothetical protein